MPSAPEEMSEFNRRLGQNSSVETQNAWGQWVPAIPLPYFGTVRVKCACGAKFWNMETYEGHYALRHILLPE